MAFQSTRQIEVRCWGNRVGALALNPKDGFYAFEYFPEFRSTGLELFPLLFPREQRGARTFPNYPEKTYFRFA